jgi:hypothetical protein
MKKALDLRLQFTTESTLPVFEHLSFIANYYGARGRPQIVSCSNRIRGAVIDWEWQVSLSYILIKSLGLQ